MDLKTGVRQQYSTVPHLNTIVHMCFVHTPPDSYILEIIGFTCILCNASLLFLLLLCVLCVSVDLYGGDQTISVSIGSEEDLKKKQKVRYCTCHVIITSVHACARVCVCTNHACVCACVRIVGNFTILC